MTASLTIDPKGGISLPPAFLQKFHLKPGATLVADLGEDGLELRPAPEANSALVVDRDGFLVFTGTEPFDAVEAIAAARANRDQILAEPQVQ